MRRRLVLATTAAGLAISASLATVGPAAAAPSNTSVHTYGCPLSTHPGKHLGWEHQANGERRNVGGTCPVDLP